MKDEYAENNKRYRLILVVPDNFSKFGWTLAPKNKNSQKVKDLENILIISKRITRFIETDDGKLPVTGFFTDFINENNF